MSKSKLTRLSTQIPEVAELVSRLAAVLAEREIMRKAIYGAIAKLGKLNGRESIIIASSVEELLRHALPATAEDEK